MDPHLELVALEPLVLDLAEALRRQGLCIATAESCTGGLIAAACTAVAGSSDWFERGFVSYSNQAKTEMLGVPPGLLELHGAVSAEVAQSMARGLYAHAPVEWTLAVTGIAGPSGGSEDKPVGTVWLALYHHGKPIKVWQELFKGDRHAVRAATVRVGLAALCEALEDRDS